jgi:hypothetical protein
MTFHMPFPVDVAGVALVAACVVGLAFITAVWVYTDAKTYADRGNPIILSIGSFQLRTPIAWFFACLLLAELFLPAYIDNRGIS